MAHAWTVPARELSDEKVAHLISNGALVVEDCDGGPFDEPALFHLMNAVKARGGHLLLTARTAPDLWGLRVPDLLSRMRLAPSATIEPPDDGLLRAVLVKLFIDRQLVVDTAVIDALVLRMERSFAAARAVVDRLDRLALERGRRVTRPLVQEALAELFPAEPS
jgi:chromosomal replication initiation ATPase DnaA